MAKKVLKIRESHATEEQQGLSLTITIVYYKQHFQYDSTTWMATTRNLIVAN